MLITVYVVFSIPVHYREKINDAKMMASVHKEFTIRKY
jgi:hypothetical protein